MKISDFDVKDLTPCDQFNMFLGWKFGTTSLPYLQCIILKLHLFFALQHFLLRCTFGFVIFGHYTYLAIRPCVTKIQGVFFSYASSSTLYPCEWVSQSVSGSYFRTSVASRLASLFFICLFVLSIFLFLDNWYTSEQIWFQRMIKFRIFGITLFFFWSTSKARKIFGITFNFF